MFVPTSLRYLALPKHHSGQRLFYLHPDLSLWALLWTRAEGRTQAKEEVGERRVQGVCPLPEAEANEGGLYNLCHRR